MDNADLDVAFLFSSDYELHLGGNYAAENEVLIKPTSRLLQTCSDIGIPMTLFADVASVWRYRELCPASEYPAAFEEQLRTAVFGGHDAQLHLHPHWLTTTFDGKRWYPDESRFKLADLGFGARTAPSVPTAEEVITRGCAYLTELIKPVAPLYECIAFRAGGYGIQPEERRVFQALLAAGLRIDSSVVPGLRYLSNVNRIDFERVPSTINYFLNPALGLSAPAESGLFEIPIPAFRESVGETVRRRLMSLPRAALREAVIRASRVGTARARGRGIQNTTFVRRVLDRLLSRGMFALELSGPVLDVQRLVDGTERFIRDGAKGSRRVYVSPSCHPKDVFEGTLVGIRDFWLAIRARFPRARAITFLAAAHEIAGLH